MRAKFGTHAIWLLMVGQFGEEVYGNVLVWCTVLLPRPIMPFERGGDTNKFGS